MYQVHGQGHREGECGPRVAGPGRRTDPDPACPQLVHQEDFVEAVREEAAAVAGRQETDSIPLVDDIRFHMGSLVQTRHAMEQAAQRLRVLEELLVSIGLDC